MEFELHVIIEREDEIVRDPVRGDVDGGRRGDVYEVMKGGRRESGRGKGGQLYIIQERERRKREERRKEAATALLASRSLPFSLKGGRRRRGLGRGQWRQGTRKTRTRTRGTTRQRNRVKRVYIDGERDYKPTRRHKERDTTQEDDKMYSLGMTTSSVTVPSSTVPPKRLPTSAKSAVGVRIVDLCG
jgi:hypothetical protein